MCLKDSQEVIGTFFRFSRFNLCLKKVIKKSRGLSIDFQKVIKKVPRTEYSFHQGAMIIIIIFSVINTLS